MKLLAISGGQFDRAFYLHAISVAKGAGLAPTNVRPHRLEYHSKLMDNKSSVQFKITQGNPHVMDVQLSDNDAFVVTGIGLGLMKVAKTSGVEQPGTFDVIHYPDPVRFQTSGEAAALENVYNALFDLKIENGSLIDNFPTGKFRMAPNQQQTATIVPETVTGTMPWGGSFTLSGDKRVTASVNYRGSEYNGVQGPDGDDDYTIYGVLFFDGYLISGGAAKVSAGVLSKVLGA